MTCSTSERAAEELKENGKPARSGLGLYGSRRSYGAKLRPKSKLGLRELMPSPTQAAVDEAFAQTKTLLRSAGFKTSGRTFVRHDGECTDIVNLQASSWNTREHIKFTLNLGVHETHLAILIGKACAAPPKTHFECMLSERVGWVVPQRGDLWWEISSENPPAQVGAWVHGVVSEFVLPWFSACHTHAGLVGALRSRGGWGAPDLLWALGEREVAIEVLDRIDARMPERDQLIREWKATHGVAEA